MDNPAAAFEAIADALGDVFACRDAAGLTDADLLSAMAAIEAVGRRADALRVAFAGEVTDRSRKGLGTDRLSAKRGCRNDSELIQRVTKVSGKTARHRIHLAANVRPQNSLAGEAMPARFEHIAGALNDGTLGVDAATAIVKELAPTLATCSTEDVAKGEYELVAAATLGGCTADDIEGQAIVWHAHLDQDGSAPAIEKTMLKRGIHLGTERDGLIPISGAVMPEIAGKLVRIVDACTSPKVSPSFAEATGLEELESDPRTKDQQRHDVFASILDIAARSSEMPMIGGAPPTVLVTVRAEDLESGTGAGFIDGIQTPIPITAVEHLVCSGGTQTVTLTDSGRVTNLGDPARCFTAKQRRAIITRDGGCLIPGCDIPASWCEIHHVTPHAQGGETHTDNGVLLCWFHHRTIDTSGWFIRMNHGIPEVKPPPWIGGQWKHATKSPTTRLNRLRT